MVVGLNNTRFIQPSNRPLGIAPLAASMSLLKTAISPPPHRTLQPAPWRQAHRVPGRHPPCSMLHSVPPTTSYNAPFRHASPRATQDASARATLFARTARLARRGARHGLYDEAVGALHRHLGVKPAVHEVHKVACSSRAAHVPHALEVSGLGSTRCCCRQQSCLEQQSHNEMLCIRAGTLAELPGAAQQHTWRTP